MYTQLRLVVKDEERIHPKRKMFQAQVEKLQINVKSLTTSLVEQKRENEKLRDITTKLADEITEMKSTYLSKGKKHLTKCNVGAGFIMYIKEISLFQMGFPKISFFFTRVK